MDVTYIVPYFLESQGCGVTLEWYLIGAMFTLFAQQGILDEGRLVQSRATSTAALKMGGI
jgi:hypothetical protein